MYSQACIKRPLKNSIRIDFQYRLLLNAGQKYCRMLQVEHSVILLTFIKTWRKIHVNVCRRTKRCHLVCDAH